MSVQYIMAIYPIIVELFQAGPKVGDWSTDITI